jgi:O-antigen ligase
MSAMSVSEGGEVQEPNPRLTQLQRLFIWLLVIPLLFFGTHGHFSFEGGGDQTVAQAKASAALAVEHDHSLLSGVVMPALSYGIILCALLFNFQGVMSIARRNKLMTFLPLLAIVSALWSQSPSRTLLNGTFFLISTLFAYFLVLRFSPDEIMNMVLRVGFIICFFGLIMVFFFPHYGVSSSDPRSVGAWLGLYPDRTGQAKYTVFFFSPAILFAASRSRWRNYVYGALFLTFIVMAKAVTALGVTSCFIAIMLLVQVSRRLERKTALFFGTIIGIICLTFVFAGDSLLEPILAFFGRNMKLTGRTEIWSAVLVSIGKSPILGYGFYGFWLGKEGESGNVIAAAHWFFGYAHQGVLEIMLQLGLVGTAVFLGTFILACKNAWFCFKYGRTVGVEWYFGLLVLTLLYNVDEETVMAPNDLLSILYMVACCGLALEAERIRAEYSAFDVAETSAQGTLVAAAV